MNKALNGQCMNALGPANDLPMTRGNSPLFILGKRQPPPLIYLGIFMPDYISMAPRAPSSAVETTRPVPLRNAAFLSRGCSWAKSFFFQTLVCSKAILKIRCLGFQNYINVKKMERPVFFDLVFVLNNYKFLVMIFFAH